MTESDLETASGNLDMYRTAATCCPRDSSIHDIVFLCSFLITTRFYFVCGARSEYMRDGVDKVGRVRRLGNQSWMTTLEVLRSMRGRS